MILIYFLSVNNRPPTMKLPFIITCMLICLSSWAAQGAVEDGHSKEHHPEYYDDMHSGHSDADVANEYLHHEQYNGTSHHNRRRRDLQLELDITQHLGDLLEGDLRDKVKDILEHFKQDDPIGIPGVPVPDPMPMPDMENKFSAASVKFKNAMVHGLKQFRIKHFKLDLTELKVEVGLAIDRMEVLGEYSMSTWFGRSSGDFNITIHGVQVQGDASLKIDDEGILRAQDINTDVKFTSLDVKFENLGFLGKMFQGMINSVGAFVFDSIKPVILDQVNSNVKGTVNKEMEALPQRFPNSIAPIDIVLSEIRKEIRKENLDPFHLPPYQFKKFIKVDLTNGIVRGASTIRRTGNLTVELKQHIISVTVNFGTGKFEGTTDWSVGTLLYSRKGTLKFSMDSLAISVTFSQALNLDKKPILKDLQVNLGNIQLHSDGPGMGGSLDYLLEAVVNIIPNLLRDQIVDAVEKPARWIVQRHLDELDVEGIIMDQLDLYCAQHECRMSELLAGLQKPQSVPEQ